MNKEYYTSLLENRSNRLQEFIEMGAPIDIIHDEALLVADAARLINPKLKVKNENQKCSATG